MRAYPWLQMMLGANYAYSHICLGGKFLSILELRPSFLGEKRGKKRQHQGRAHAGGRSSRLSLLPEP